MDQVLTKWLPFRKPQPAVRLLLLCLPWGGGGASSYCSWARQFPPYVELWAIQTPGREGRMLEPPLTDVMALVAQLGEVIGPQLRLPFCLFGHSVGALVCFEFARWLRRNALPAPNRLIVTGAMAPRERRDLRIHHLPDHEFLENVCKYEGVPAQILNHPDMLSLILPALRADFQMFETYRYYPEPPLDCPISAYGGLQDIATDELGIKSWRHETTRDFKMEMFPGGHFFLQTARERFLKELSDQLLGDGEVLQPATD
jgi:medium-chain acyl-[acyl-carrier-protein] hydrolase